MNTAAKGARSERVVRAGRLTCGAHAMSPQAAALRLYRNALMRALAVRPSRSPRLWACADAARRLAEALGVPSGELAAAALVVLREDP